jgi:hypothetical protein
MDVVVNDVAKASVDVADDDGASMDLVREVTVSKRTLCSAVARRLLRPIGAAGASVAGAVTAPSFGGSVGVAREQRAAAWRPKGCRAAALLWLDGCSRIPTPGAVVRGAMVVMAWR